VLYSLDQEISPLVFPAVATFPVTAWRIEMVDEQDYHGHDYVW